MASLLMTSSKAILFFLIIFSSLQYFSASSFEFEVGETNGWDVPPSNKSKIYNQWASKNRFKMGDAIHFKYEKDSVMLVSDLEYRRCNSTHPFFFSNNGNTVFKLDRSGLFYFISGVSGHCERGQKMIVRVMATDEDSDEGDNSSGSNGAVPTSASVSTLVLVQLVLSFMGSLLI